MAELCNLVHRYASTSTAIIVTVRLFARSSAPHGEHKRSKSLVRTIGCGVLPLVLGWRCVRVCQTSAEWTSTRPSSKQRSAPRRPLWCSKVTFNGSFRRKNGTRLVHVCFLFVWLAEWPVSCRYWPCTIVRVFFQRPFTRKGPHFLSLGLVVAPVRLEYRRNLH